MTDTIEDNGRKESKNHSPNSSDQAINEESKTFKVSGESSNYSLTPELQNAISETVKEEIQKEIAVDKASLFTVFGIFASIVTFVSVEIQILKTICDFWNIAGFSLIIFASLLMFILLLDYIGRGWRNDSRVVFPWKVAVFSMIFLIMGFFSAFFGNEQRCRDNAIYQRYESDFTERQIEIETIFDEKIQELENNIKNNSEQIQYLRNAL